MKNHIPFLTATCVLLLAGCTNDQAWMELKEKQEAEAQRLTELQKTIDGLKKSDSPFSLVLTEAPADTVSKGLDFTGIVRVNPSGVALTKDMVALDYISGKQFYPVGPEEGTKASYVKKSDYFSLKGFEADKNASSEVLDGQYVATLTTSAKEAVWDDSRLAFVGAYVDKDGKNQLVSSHPFKTVMMPLPEEGLSPWVYPHASFLIREKKHTPEGAEYFEDNFGTVYVPLDGVVFKTKDDTDGRFYAAENLGGISFALDDDCGASVKMEYDLKKRYVSFVPDTTGNLTWRAFQDSTGIKRQEVKGTMLLKDRWGGVSSYHLNMYWYNSNVLPLHFEGTPEEIKKGIQVDFVEEVKKLGLDYTDLEKARRVTPGYIHRMYNDLTFEPFDDKQQEKGELVLYTTPVPGETYRTEELRTLTVGVSEVDTKMAPVTLSFKLAITLTVKAGS